MRPPLNAGENPRPGGSLLARLTRFNEAPAERGGKPRPRHRTRRASSRFNEAPAERGGKPDLDLDVRGQRLDASMRPPLNAGENIAM